jgi:hypothetical protein
MLITFDDSDPEDPDSVDGGADDGGYHRGAPGDDAEEPRR